MPDDRDEAEIWLASLQRGALADNEGDGFPPGLGLQYGPPFRPFFGEQGARFPGSPTLGPYIGRGAIAKKQTVDNSSGETSVMETMVIGRRGESVTLCLTRRDAKPAASPNVDPLNLNAPLVARLVFGAGAAREACEVDWLNGTLLTVPAGSVGVTCFYPNIPVGITPSANLDQAVGVIIAEGIRPPSAGRIPMARLTRRFSLVAAPGPGSSFADVLPNRAIAVSLLTTDPLNYGSYEVAFRSSANPAVVGSGAVYSRERPANSDELTIPNGTRSVLVSNLAAFNVDISLVYTIAL